MSVGQRRCQGTNSRNEPCGAPPLRDDEFCFQHSDTTTEEAAQARELGGRRRRREGTLRTAYDVDGIASVEDLQRVLSVALLDTLALENSMARNRTLVYLVEIGRRLFETGALAERVAAVEQAITLRRNGEGTR